MLDIIIIGAGPGGLGAGLYTARSGFSTLIIEGSFVGGQTATTFEVDNYLGFETTISGAELTDKMKNHAQKFGVQIISEEVKSIDLSKEIKKVITSKNEYDAKVIIFAMGAKSRTLELESEERLKGMGVSYCATCDGAFFRNKAVCVVGGGDTALEDALFLERFCSKVTLIHRRNAFRGNKGLSERVSKSAKIDVLYDSIVQDIIGEEMVESIKVKNLVTEETSELKVSGVFVAVGTIPQNEIIPTEIVLDKDGYIITDENMKTSIDGVYACGDIRKKPLRQIITAVADGAIAAYSAEIYILENGF